MRWWSLANLVSNTGTWMQLTVQNVLVLQLSGSPALTGLSVAVQAAPGLLLGLVGGAAVDAWPRRLTAAFSQLALGLVAFTTAVLVAFGLLTVPLLLLLAAASGVIATVDAPACALLGNDLVRKEDVPSAIALGSVVYSVGRLAGAALAGGAVVLFGTGAAFAANGLSFLFVASVIPFLRPADRAERAGPERDDPEPAGSTPDGLTPAGPEPDGSEPDGSEPGGRETDGKDAAGPAAATVPARAAASSAGALREGLVYFVRRPRLVALAAITGVCAIFGRNYTLTLAVLVTGPLAAGAGSFGTVATALAVGGTLGALLAGTLRKPSVRLIAAMAATGAVLQIAAGLSPTLLVLMVLVVPMAVVESVSDTAGATVLLTEPPARLRGRVMGVWRSLSTGWGLLGPLTIGLLMELFGARATLVVGGVVIAAAAGAGTLLHARRTSRAVPVTEVALPVAPHEPAGWELAAQPPAGEPTAGALDAGEPTAGLPAGPPAGPLAASRG